MYTWKLHNYIKSSQTEQSNGPPLKMQSENTGSGSDNKRDQVDHREYCTKVPAAFGFCHPWAESANRIANISCMIS